MTSYVYVLRNTAESEPSYYVGKSNTPYARLNQHKASANHPKTYFSHIIADYGWGVFQMVELTPHTSESEAYRFEAERIRQLSSHGYKLYNIVDGASQHRGTPKKSSKRFDTDFDTPYVGLLPKEESSLIALLAQGLTQQDIARKTGLCHASVAYRLRRAKHRLRVLNSLQNPLSEIKLTLAALGMSTWLQYLEHGCCLQDTGVILRCSATSVGRRLDRETQRAPASIRADLRTIRRNLKLLRFVPSTREKNGTPNG